MRDTHQSSSIKRLLDKALRDYTDGNIIATIEAANQAFRQSNNTNPDAVYLVGLALSGVPRIRAAEKAMLAALRLDPKHAPAAAGLASILFATNKGKEALLFLEGRGIEGDSQLRDTALGIALEVGDAAFAMDGIRAQSNTAPATTEMHHKMAQAAAALQKWQDAVRHLEAARAIDPVGASDGSMPLVARTVAKAEPTEGVQRLTERVSELTDTPPDSPDIESELIRYCPLGERTVDPTAWPTTDIDTKSEFTAYTDFSRRLWKDAAPPSGTWACPPPIHRQPLVDGLQRLLELTEQLKAQGAFQHATDDIAKIRETFAPSAEDPILVLSTGRCGTEGLHHALTTSPRVLPFHTMPWRMMPGDRNHVLYRLLTGNLDREVLERIFNIYLECRTTELIGAYGRNKVPMLINHWDTIFAPLLAVLFPKAKFLHLHRSELSVMRSILGKNQWRSRQLQYWRFDPAFPDGRFLFDQAPDVPLEANVAWYLHLTKTLAEAFCDVIAPERFAAFQSERLFKQDPEEIERLCRFLPEGAADAASLRACFSEKRNEKAIMQEVSEEDLDRSAELTAKYLDRLRATGTLDA